MKAIKKKHCFIALLLIVTTFNTYKTHAMEPNNQQKLFELFNDSWILEDPETLAQFESLCKKADVDLNFFYPDFFTGTATLLIKATSRDKYSTIIQILLD